MNEKYYTKDGYNALKTRLETMIRWFNDDNYPIKKRFWGFQGIFRVKDSDELLARISELGNVISAKLELKTEIIKTQGRSVRRRKIQWLS